MNVEVESANRSDSSDPLPGPVNFLDCKRKHRVRQREQRKCPEVAASLYCPWSMAQSALGFITGNGTVLGMGLGSTCTRSLSPSPPPLSLSPQPVVSDEPDSSPKVISFECRKRLGLPITAYDVPDCASGSEYIPDLDYYADMKKKIANWNDNYPEPSCCPASPTDTPSCSKGQKVTFCETLDHVKTFEDDEESRACRMGCWSIDGERFRNRIKEAEHLLSPVFHVDHREKIFSRLHAADVNGVDNNALHHKN